LLQFYHKLYLINDLTLSLQILTKFYTLVETGLARCRIPKRKGFGLVCKFAVRQIRLV